MHKFKIGDIIRLDNDASRKIICTEITGYSDIGYLHEPLIDSEERIIQLVFADTDGNYHLDEKFIKGKKFDTQLKELL